MAPPKRREEDQQNFLQAFEKPTQIYRYLRTRNLVSPIFLYRNLNYMAQRMSRTHKRRSTFKIDSLLADKIRSSRAACSCFGNNMTMTFQGYFDRFQSSTPPTGTPAITAAPVDNNNHLDVAIVKPKIRLEVLLLKIAQKKRKDSSSTSIKQIGVVEIPQNPADHLWEKSNGKFPTLSLSTELLDPADGPVTQIVVFRTQPVVPAANKDEQQHFSSELMIFNKTGKCLLIEGDYQLSLQEAFASPAATAKNGCSPKKYSSWENLSVFNSDSSGFEDQFEKNPIVKFQLQWTERAYCGDHERLVELKAEPLIKVEAEEEEDRKELTNGASSGGNNNNKGELVSSSRKSSAIEQMDRALGYEIFGVPAGDLQIAFHFIFNNVSYQTSKQTNSMDCPWCALNCLSLYSLLKHLKLCHARFAFNFVQSGATARIEVSINELFDGSYAGSPYNCLTTSSAGYAFSRSGPVRRTSVTHVLVCRPRRLKPSLTEFIETDEALEMNGGVGCNVGGGHDRPYLTGHNRLYHHTMTCLPVHPRELDVDSEEECDPPWLKQKTMMMIDEFTDVNEGEKELMKMWNLHVMRHGFVGDCQTALACEMFVELHGRELLDKNLYRNFVVHMCSLFDYGLVSSEAFHKAVQKLQRSLNESTEAKQVIYNARAQHLQHWNTTGLEKYQQQQLREKEEAEAAAKEVATGNNKKKRTGGVEEKTGTEAGASSTVTRSRELFQKPRLILPIGIGGALDAKKGTVGNGGGGSGGDAGKKKTGPSGGNGKQSGGGPADSSSKRKMERELSPTRRRSADLTGSDGAEKRARLEITRRKSIAVIESTNGESSGKPSRTLKIKSKTRLSLTLGAKIKDGKK